MWLGLSKQNFLTLLLSPILLLRRTLTAGFWQLTAWQWTWTTPFDSLATVILLVWSKSWLLPCFCKKHRTLKIIHLMIWDSLKRIVFLQFLMSSRLEQKFNSKKKFRKIQNSNSKTSFQFKKRGGWVLWRDWEKCLHQGRGALTQQAGGGREQVSAEVALKPPPWGRDVRYTMRVTGVHNDSLERQITEAVNIANFRGPALMNRRGELGGVRIEPQQYRRWGAND